MPQNPYNAPVAVTYNHITAPGTFVVKGAPGAVFSLNINNGTGTIGLFDQATTITGTVGIAVLNCGTSIVTPSRVDIGPSYGGLNFKTGLVAVVTGTVDATIGFR